MQPEVLPPTVVGNSVGVGDGAVVPVPPLLLQVPHATGHASLDRRVSGASPTMSHRLSGTFATCSQFLKVPLASNPSQVELSAHVPSSSIVGELVPRRLDGAAVGDSVMTADGVTVGDEVTTADAVGA